MNNLIDPTSLVHQFFIRVQQIDQLFLDGTIENILDYLKTSILRRNVAE
jgi:hypothetical protein